MRVREMMKHHPMVAGGAIDVISRCVEECMSCAQACTSCADACLGEAGVQMLAPCIRLNLDCADVCVVTGRLASRRTGGQGSTSIKMLEACVEACRMCGAECDRHAQMHEHCRVCAEACRSCELACRDALGGVH